MNDHTMDPLLLSSLTLSGTETETKKTTISRRSHNGSFVVVVFVFGRKRGEGGDLDGLEVHNILFMEGDGWS